jgi:hypothetical protein
MLIKEATQTGVKAKVEEVKECEEPNGVGNVVR